MDTFIGSLPIGSGDSNVCTRSQVAAMKEKGWTPYFRTYRYGYEEWLEYEGSDDDPSGITKPIIETENANTPAYNLSGQKVAGAKKGIYIVNGKKVAIK